MEFQALRKNKFMLTLIVALTVFADTAFAAFTSSVTEKTVMGNKRVVIGTFTNTGGSTGGDIATGLSVVDACFLQHVDTAVITNAPVVNETFPLMSGDVTIVTDGTKSGNFIAFGR